MIEEGKIKKEYRLLLNSFIGKTYDKDLVIDEEVYLAMCKVSMSSGLEVAVFITRKGEILDIVLGESDRVKIPSLPESNRLKLNGIRLIHTHPYASCTLSDLDKSALRNNRFDFVCAVSIDQLGCKDAEVGFINGDKVDTVKVNDARFLNKYGIMDKLSEYDKLYKDNSDKFTYLEEGEKTAILVGVELHKGDRIEESLEELKNLAETHHIRTLQKVYQKKSKPDPKYMVGEGKLSEIRSLVQNLNPDMVIFDNELSANRQTNLENALGVEISDRSRIILEIFAERARSAEGKLQVELARQKYSLPRLSKELQNTGRFGGGAGMRGPGESMAEYAKRVVYKNIDKLEKELEKVRQQRATSRKQRQRNDKKTVAIVGYTNSGKSTLLNLLTRENVYVKDELFATLDTTTRQFHLAENKDILLVDTVGFINKLPHEFIDAFSSTLEETIFADLLLHVIDVSNPEHTEQERVVNELLRKLGANAPIIKVYNKVDKVNIAEEEKDSASVYISAKNNINIDGLKNAILERME